jgi:nitrous oxide reductase accessory protein NosL
LTTGALIDPRDALYIVGSNVSGCCKPSTLTFQHEEEAIKFQQQHGGTILSYEQTIADIGVLMLK